MLRFAANLSMMFTDLPFLDRFAAAADQGFAYVEYLFPYTFTPDELARALEKNGLRQALFNLSPGDWDAGMRGLACLPGREKEFEASVEKAILYAKALKCPMVHAMAGIPPASVTPEKGRAVYLANIRLAAGLLAAEGLQLCLEPINQISMPGYFLRDQAQAVGYIKELGLPNVRLQFDFFHRQMQEGNVAGGLRACFPFIGHCQIAGAPERHEPDRGELHYPHLFALLEELGYAGAIGCEYNPAGNTAAGLAWIRPYGVTARK